jgi:hypothetical protein
MHYAFIRLSMRLLASLIRFICAASLIVNLLRGASSGKKRSPLRSRHWISALATQYSVPRVLVATTLKDDRGIYFPGAES